MRSVLFLALVMPLLGQTPPDSAEFFEKKIRPIFATKCSACHGARVKMGGLDLSSVGGLMQGTSAGPVVAKGDPDGSRLFRAITYANEIKMPPSGKLSDVEIAAVREWIEKGALLSIEAPSAPSAATGRRITDADRQHWAFRPLKAPELPAVKGMAWVKAPVDQFILAKLEEKGLKPAPPASKLVLLRRVTYDLTGLPPTPEDIESFLKDKSPDAFSRVVDRLLGSPEYGERWGRHWLDLARYADSTGMDEDHIYPHAWRYRDYVVDAFNRDLPYDRFVKEQIAGDLLPAATSAEHERSVIATGFLALGPRPLAQQDRIQMLYDVADEQIDSTSKVFMGLTVACARCHDHKFDPILTKDYYSLASIFASTRTFRNLGRPGSVSYIYEAPLDGDAYARYQAHKSQLYGKQLELEEAFSEDWAREYALLRPKIADYLSAAWKVHTGLMKADAAGLDSKLLRSWVDFLEKADEAARKGYLMNWFEAKPDTIGQVAQDYQKQYEKAASKWDDGMEKWRRRFASDALQDRDVPARPKPDKEEYPFFAAVTFDHGPLELPDSPRVAQLRREYQQLEKTTLPEPPMATAVTEGPRVDQTVFIRGDHHQHGAAVQKTFPVVLAGEHQKQTEHGSGRLELAEWLASPSHPLTARVMVNRIWQWHFGEALVRTPNNWGKTGDVPVEKELLDYLANRFIESGWSVKAMHRLILLSSTYQTSTEASPEVQQADPANRLCAHFNRLRMSIEQIRDSLMVFDGTLDHTRGGSLLPAKKEKRPKTDPDEITRRTIYLPVRRGSVPVVLSSFDFGDATTPSEGRPRTNVAPQALFFMNSRFASDHARGLAKRLLDDTGVTDAERVKQAYLTVLTRSADASEIDNALSYIGGYEKRWSGQDAHLAAWQSFCHVLVETNEFVYIN